MKMWRKVDAVRFTRLNVDEWGEAYEPQGMASAPGYIGTVVRDHNTWYCFEDQSAAKNALGGVVEQIEVILPLWKQVA
jgi:hypothetical protein